MPPVGKPAATSSPDTLLMHNFRIEAQPDDDSCGATALHAVYRYFGNARPLHEVIDEVHKLKGGGTLAVMLGLHALKNGFQARIYSYNLNVFDPSWAGLGSAQLTKKLVAQTRIKRDGKLQTACLAYARFLKEGGEIRFEDLTPGLLQRYMRRKLPVLAGLSATYLYQSKREYPDPQGRSVYHDLRGKPMGHFVVLSGGQGDLIRVADPYSGNPYSNKHIYLVDIDRLINSIMLGIVTYDANLLILSPTPIEQ